MEIMGVDQPKEQDDPLMWEAMIKYHNDFLKYVNDYKKRNRYIANYLKKLEKS